MIKISPKSKVYVLCPASLATGGPELLHQLSFHLINIGINAFMLYVPTDIEDPIHPYYKHYNIPLSRTVENDEHNLLIIPEALPGMIYDKRFSEMQKVMWWLSVENYFHALDVLVKRHSYKKTFKLKNVFNYYKIPYLKWIAKNNKVSHFVQSTYAEDFLKKNKFKKISYLSDYLSESFLNRIPSNTFQRQDIVLYNPKKGLDFTQQIIKSASHIKFLPIENLAPSEVSNLLSTSKVYIDFGNHPGKDRFPREAAIMGCCILTNQKGAANFHDDVPIDDEFKFIDKQEYIHSIIKKIENCLQFYETESKKFDNYRNIILNEQKRFSSDVKKLFIG